MLLAESEANPDWIGVPALDIPIQPGRTNEATIELSPGVVVSGSIVEADSRPVAGATLAAFYGGEFRLGFKQIESSTDDSGIFRFRLPPGKAEIHKLNLGRPDSWLRQADAIRSVDVPAGVATFTLPPIALTAIKTARVVDSAGKPIANARVWESRPWINPQDADQDPATSDDQGRLPLARVYEGRQRPPRPKPAVVSQPAVGMSLQVTAVGKPEPTGLELKSQSNAYASIGIGFTAVSARVVTEDEMTPAVQMMQLEARLPDGRSFKVEATAHQGDAEATIKLPVSL